MKLPSTKKIKPGSGLGSSAASAAGAAFEQNELLEIFFLKKSWCILRCLVKNWRLVLDTQTTLHRVFSVNYLGKSSEPMDIIPLSSPDLYVTAVHPQLR